MSDLTPLPDRVAVAVVGSGFAGLGMAIRLRREGITDFVVLERAGDLGGTWRANTYPGCACDVPSHLYSYSFAPNPHWGRTFSDQPEIWAYLRRCAEDFGVTGHLRYRCEVTGADWDAQARCWRIRTSRGALTARVLVSATGALSDPTTPDIDGLADFTGTLFHSAEWDHGSDLAGRRVAVVGTGASAIQFVPRIAPEVARLHLFCRTPPWVLPRPDRDLTRIERWVYQRVPAAQRLVRIGIYWARELTLPAFTGNDRMRALAERRARAHLARQVPDPELRAKLTPDYRIGCKRILISDDFYPALSRPNVEVVTEPVVRVRARSVVTADGAERDVDAIILATGFRVTDLPAAGLIRGADGRSLADAWQGSPNAYLGTSVAGFPNLFLLVGPNTGLGHTSMVFMIESQVNYVLDCLRGMRERGLATADVRPEVQASYNAGLDAAMSDTVWVSGGCRSWYLDRTGRNSTLWPGPTWRFRRRTRRFRPADYTLEPDRTPART